MKGPASTGVGDRLGSPSGAAGFCFSLVGPHIPPGASGARRPRSWHGEGCNLPGWPWAMITKVALDRLSRSLHSDVCDSDKCGDAVACSRISGRGNRRLCAVPNYISTQCLPLARRDVFRVRGNTLRAVRRAFPGTRGPDPIVVAL